MENNINKKKSNITKNPLNTNKQEEGETNDLLLGKEKTENQNITIKNQSTENSSDKNILKEELNNIVKKQNNNNEMNSLNIFNKPMEKNNIEQVVNNKRRRMFLPFGKEKKIYLKNNVNIKSILKTSKPLFQNSYNLDDVYKNKQGFKTNRSKANTNYKNYFFNFAHSRDISRNTESRNAESRNAEVDNLNRSRTNISQDNKKFKTKLNLTTTIQELKTKNTLLKVQPSQTKFEHNTFNNTENNKINNNLSNLDKNDKNTFDKNLSEKIGQKKQKKNFIRTLDDKSMEINLLNIDNKNNFKESNKNNEDNEDNNIENNNNENNTNENTSKKKISKIIKKEH